MFRLLSRQQSQHQEEEEEEEMESDLGSATQAVTILPFCLHHFNGKQGCFHPMLRLCSQISSIAFPKISLFG